MTLIRSLLPITVLALLAQTAAALSLVPVLQSCDNPDGSKEILNAQYGGGMISFDYWSGKGSEIYQPTLASCTAGRMVRVTKSASRSGDTGAFVVFDNLIYSDQVYSYQDVVKELANSGIKARLKRFDSTDCICQFVSDK